MRALGIFACAAILFGASRVEATPKGWIEIHGNVALPTDVYLTVIDLVGTSSAAPTLEARAKTVRSLLLRFLRGSGYELATIEARVDHGRIVLDVDEGRLDKIIFVDQGAVRSLELRLAVGLPGRVFNRPLLERRLAALTELFDVERARYEVVPVRNADRSVFELEDPGFITGLKLLSPGEPHELRVYLEYDHRAGGLDFGLGLGPPDGIAIDARYRLHDIFLESDRLGFTARAGARLAGGVLTATGNRLSLSRARLAVDWLSPPVIFEQLRTRWEVDGDLIGRTRDDLGIDQYYYMAIRGTGALELALSRALSVAAGGGLEQRLVFGVEPETISEEIRIQSRDHFRPFAVGRLGMVLNPDELRKDRLDRIDLEARYYATGSDDSASLWRFSAALDVTWSLGWDEVRVDANGVLLGKDPPYYLHVPLGKDHMRAPFRDVFVERVVSASVEYRLSLTRDLLKLGFWNDLALASRAPQRDEVRVYESFGLGVHMLLLDTFQFNTYTGVGFADDGSPVSLGFSLEFIQAF